MAFAEQNQSLSADEVCGSIREFVLKRFPLARKRQIKNSEPLLEGGLLDSMGVLEVVTFIEQEFGVMVADEDLAPENFQTIERIAAYIQNQSAKASQ